jgi:hypothetical protein
MLRCDTNCRFLVNCPVLTGDFIYVERSGNDFLPAAMEILETLSSTLGTAEERYASRIGLRYVGPGGGPQDFAHAPQAPTPQT